MMTVMLVLPVMALLVIIKMMMLVVLVLSSPLRSFLFRRPQPDLRWSSLAT
jgi:hypothetical protein